jgi:PQQ-dependent dehydrogenase (methanol/ethanol family)
MTLTCTRFASLLAVSAAAGALSATAHAQLSDAQFEVAAPAAKVANVSPVTDAELQSPPPGEWLSWRRTLDDWGYSPLSQINRSNVSRLGLSWVRGLNSGLQEGTPLVRDGVLFMVQPGDLIETFDAATGTPIWRNQRPRPADLKGAVPYPDIKRNIAIWGDLIINTSADGYVYALNARTGAPVWQTQVTDYRVNPAQQTSGPIVANGKVISGRGCEPKGGPEACVITAHDARTGKELWRTHTIAKPGEPGGDSWGDVPWEARWHVGTWQPPSYDPETNLLFFGTSVTSPAPKFALAGNDKTYLYHNSTLALDADNGRIVWHYQHVVDHWDMDHTFERYLLDEIVAPDPKNVLWINPRLKPGERRSVVQGIPGKTGIIYALDRKTGEFLWATPTVRQNIVSSIDPSTGTVTVNPEVIFSQVGQKREVCPSAHGGKNWPAGAYSPLTKMLYFPLQQTCMDVTSTINRADLRSLYGVRVDLKIAPGVTDMGTVQAFSAETGALKWKQTQRAGAASLVATGGGLLFGGDADGRFRAFDQKTGKVLWSVSLGAPITGFPITYAVNGRQFVAVSTGSSLTAGALNSITQDLHPGNFNALFVFEIMGK